MDEVFEKLLRENNIYPPSVQDSHYYDTPELTRAEIILKTLREMGMLLPSGQCAQSGDEADFLSNIVTELQRRLPYGSIKTCGAFRHLKAGCCNSCHTEYPHAKMKLIGRPDGGTGWVCCAMDKAIYPERYAKRMERFWNSPKGKRWRERFGEADRRKGYRCGTSPMRKELEEKPVERWPSWFNLSGDPRRTLMPFGCQYGGGSFNILCRLCLDLDPMVPELEKETGERFEAVQAEEKLGTLRFYAIHHADPIDEPIVDAQGKGDQ
jgi:hypothetical protein